MKLLFQYIFAFIVLTNVAMTTPPTWSVVASAYQYNASITSIVVIDDIANNDSNNILGAFVGDTVRGVTSPIVVGNAQMYFLTVYSNTASGDTLRFKLYYAIKDTILSVNEKITFLPDAQIGDPVTPFQFHSTSIPLIPVTHYHYNAGWNIVSIACNVSDYEKATLFPTALSNAFSFLNGYQSNSALVHGVGYWLKFPTDSLQRSVSIEGYGIEQDTVMVNAGWNMIGSLSYSIATSSVQPVGTTVQSSYFSFQNGYQVTDTIQPGNGYWVKVSNNGSLVLHSSVRK